LFVELKKKCREGWRDYWQTRRYFILSNECAGLGKTNLKLTGPYMAESAIKKAITVEVNMAQLYPTVAGTNIIS
jgi:hypothetical protein